MKPEWLIEEDLIEWTDTVTLRRYGREIRLVNPQGEIVGRRLAATSVTEHYLLFRDGRVYTWLYPFAQRTVFCAKLSESLRRFWTGRSLMTYGNDTSGNLYGNVTWKLLERDSASELKFCPEIACSRRMVERYKYLPHYGNSSDVEWRICFHREPPLLGRGVPVCSELWWDGKLKRRHTLLHYRVATAEERAFFNIPRNARIRQGELGLVFSPLTPYVPILLNE